MKTKSARNPYRYLLLGILLFAPVTCAAQDSADALTRLQILTSSITTLCCNFTQRTNILLLAEPVVSKGKMLFQIPNKLVWEIMEPMQEGFVLNEDSGYRWDENRKNRRSFKTSDDQLAKLISTQIRAWVKFDQKWLQSKYSIHVEQDHPLCLALVPRNSEARSTVSLIRIVFANNGVAMSVELQEANGNNTFIIFENVHVNKHIDNQEFE
ncbi:MAG: outer membrane lipoprotein carrier protein LolA [Desulfovibrio sp.]|jgi:outer membrane lipoprotein carrier protein|nr:outer membrane lipoprotein carrier protein LolA [Desulfovibrio sp.]